jgi:hypothetical protein
MSSSGRYSFLVCLFIILLSCLVVGEKDATFSASIWQDFPEDIPVFPVRLLHNGQPVARGLLADVERNHETNFTLAAFKERLQCSESEPGLNGHNGAISLLRLSPPSRALLEMYAVWAEGIISSSSCSSFSSS